MLRNRKLSFRRTMIGNGATVNNQRIEGNVSDGVKGKKNNKK